MAESAKQLLVRKSDGSSVFAAVARWVSPSRFSKVTIKEKLATILQVVSNSRNQAKRRNPARP